jgi:hypothetical protein
MLTHVTDQIPIGGVVEWLQRRAMSKRRGRFGDYNDDESDDSDDDSSSSKEASSSSEEVSSREESSR